MKTKRSLLLVCALVVLTLCVTLCACNTSQAKPDYDYLVTFDYNVGTLDANCQTQYLGVKANSLVGLKPGTRDDFKQYEASGYYLEGWYLPEKDADGNVVVDADTQMVKLATKWDFSTMRVNSDMTLYARLLRVPTMIFVDRETGEEVKRETGTPESRKERPSAVVEPVKSGYTYFDTIYEEESIEEYVLSKAKAISGVSAGTYRLNKTDYFVINEQGIITTAENGQTTQFGYISGTKTNFTIKYKIGSSSIKTIEGAMVLGGNILCGNYKNDPKMYVYGSESVKDFNCSDDGAHIYEHVVGDKKVYIYTVGGKYSKATITGEVGNGNKITVAYKFYNGESPAVDGSKEYMFVSDTSMVDAGEELGTYTAEGKDSITFDGFGSATIGEKAYSYIINKNNVVVLKSDSETIGVTLDSEAKTYAIATSDGFARSYADANSEYYTVEFDGFGGVNVIYKSKNSTTVYAGTYTLGTGTVTVKDAIYSYDKEYTVEESGNVLVSADGKVVLAVAGYTVDSKISIFDGYYVNGDNTIEIVVAEDKTFKVYFNGKAVTANANWNGTILTLKNMSDYDAAKTGWFSDFTIVKDGENIKMSHDCKQSYDSSYEEFETIEKSETFTKTTKPSGGEDLDAFAGTWKFGSVTFVFDGKGSVTVSGSYEGTYTYSIDAAGTTATFYNSAYYETMTCKLNSDGSMTVNDQYGDWLRDAKFTKQA